MGVLVHDRDPRRPRHGARRLAVARVAAAAASSAASLAAVVRRRARLRRSGAGRRRSAASSARSAARSARRRSSPARCGAAARAAAPPRCSRLASLVGAALAFVPVVGYLEALAVPLLGLQAAPPRAGPPRRAPHRSPATDASDGEAEAGRPGRHRRPDAVDVRGRRHAGAALPARAREYRRAASTFPSLTPVCLSSIATGAHGDVHHIPHLVWWYRDEQRLVEYGSSFGAVRAAGLTRSLRDTIIDLNARHLAATPRRSSRRSRATASRPPRSTSPATAARTGTSRSIPGVPAVYGPKRFFFYSLYESDRTGAPHRGAQPRARLDRRVRGVGRPLARHARRVRLPRLLPARLRLRVACGAAPTPRTRRSRAATRPWPR